MGLADLGLSYSFLHAFAADLQCMIVAGVRLAVPYPSLSAMTVKFATLSLRFACGVAGDGDLPTVLVIT